MIKQLIPCTQQLTAISKNTIKGVTHTSYLPVVAYALIDDGLQPMVQCQNGMVLPFYSCEGDLILTTEQLHSYNEAL